MVTSVDNDQRSSTPGTAVAPVLEQSPAAVVDTLPAPAPAVEQAGAVDEPAAEPTPAPDAAPALPGSVAPIEVAAAVDVPGPGDGSAAADGALAARLQVAEERAAAAESTLADLTERLGGLEARAEQAEGAVGALERAVAAADDQLETLTARLADVADVAARDRAGTAAIGTDVAELQETVRRLDQDTSVAVAREVERHTTAGLVDGQQRLHQASIAMAGLAQSLADAARQITPELTADSARTLLDSFAVDVDLLLQQLGHEAIGVGAGDPFDPKRHRALRRVPTEDSAADRTVARVLRDGYRTPATDRVLVFADVEVHRFTAAGSDGATSSEKGN